MNQNTLHITQLLEKGVKQQLFPGASVVLTTQNSNGVCTSHILSTGKIRYSDHSSTQNLVTEKTVFDIASVTKSIMTSTVALLFIQNGWMHLNDTVQSWQGNFATQANLKSKTKNRNVSLKIHHLLTHTVQFDIQMSSLKNKSAKDILKSVTKATITQKPGSSYAYVNATSMLLGLEIERIAKKHIKQLLHNKPLNIYTIAQKYIFEPLGMNQTVYGAVPYQQQVAPSEIDSWRNKEIRGEVHDESTWALLNNTPNFSIHSGAAGIFTNAHDMSLFMQNFLKLSSQTKKMISTDQRASLGTQHQTMVGLGWELAQRHWMGNKASNATIGKTGFTGCCIVMDLEKKIGITFLCNHTYPKRPINRTKINDFRKQLLDAAFECIV